ncbi:hypothetical protein [Paenibacillus silviterrae]|uniref:hypothetical protein n=1 Tax=Paenibacillus silviterrae TaxID=3242194 RepID=UPI002543031F|nr:hypothetical protein [Paenibacillus chinjuensis]
MPSIVQITTIGDHTYKDNTRSKRWSSLFEMSISFKFKENIVKYASSRKTIIIQEKMI